MLIDEPKLRTNRVGIEECRMRLAVPRRARDGRREPGIIYVDVTTFGLEAQECADRLSQGACVGISGRLDDEHGILIDQLDFL
jgi:single-stranded DNA-binding protein